MLPENHPRSNHEPESSSVLRSRLPSTSESGFSPDPAVAEDPPQDHDAVYEDFLRAQYEAGMALANQSEILELIPCGRAGVSVDRYVARLHCKGLVQNPNTREILEADRFDVGIYFPKSHLKKRIAPHRVLSLLSPLHTFNANAKWPHLCPGYLTAGMGIVDLLYQAWEILSGRKQTIVEHLALNPDACKWARSNPERFPFDDRPLKSVGTADTEGDPS
jgi:hypothetical protein